MRLQTLSEKAVELYLRQEIERYGGICYKFVSPGRVGVPDRLCVLPKGKFFFVEVKQANGKLSPMQIREIKRLETLEQPIFVVYSKQQVDNILEVLYEL